MYYPIQMPYILRSDSEKVFSYIEEIVPDLQKFAICFYEFILLSSELKTVKSVIITDGCVDLLVDYKSKSIGFVGQHIRTCLL